MWGRQGGGGLTQVSIILGVVASIIGGVLLSVPAHAAMARDFRPGNIIDDAVFYNKDAMSVAEIQTFLDQHVPACDTWGRQRYGNGTREQYARSRGWHGAPYPCLQQYHENPQTGETSFERGGGAFPGGMSTAQIIWQAAQENGINPQVLLVMLKKEQGSLFTDDWPLKSQYKYAMGYACPDSGPGFSANCVSAKGGLYKQIHLAAWQLKRYKEHIHEYQYRPGRTNYIQYNPNPACGGKNVYIENVATASLYIYTPYVPSDAALNAYPGETHCGAYGNRNFFFFFHEWFGAPRVTSSFVRSERDSTVYLISDDTKYPVSAMHFVSAASRLGQVQFVSQGYLDGKTTGFSLTRLIRSKDGTVYFYDSNIKLPFGSCQQIADYGYTCGQSIRLSDNQLARFSDGPMMTDSYMTTSGSLYGIRGGKKYEAFDQQTLTQQGFSGVYNRLDASGIAHLQLAPPLLKADTIVEDNATGEQYYVDGALRLNRLATQNARLAFTGKFPLQRFSHQSVLLAPHAQGIWDKVVVAGQHYLLANGQLLPLTSGDDFPGSVSEITPAAAQLLRKGPAAPRPLLIKSPQDATVYAFVHGKRRPVPGMQDLAGITGQQQPVIATLDQVTVNGLPEASLLVAPGALIKSHQDATVYMADGFERLIPLTSFAPAKELGLSLEVRSFAKEQLQGYTVAPGRLQAYIAFGQRRYIAAGGKLYHAQELRGSMQPLPLDERTQQALANHKAGELPGFLRGSDGTIYQRNAITLHPIRSMQTFRSLGGNAGNLLQIDSNQLLHLFERGAVK